MFCFTKSAYSHKKGNDNIVVFKGNTFEFSGPAGKDVVIHENKVQGTEIQVKQKGEEPMTVSFFAAPVKMNGKPIHSAGEVTKEPVFLGEEKSLSKYLFNSAKTELDRLEDGEYFIHISYPVVDEKGKIVYYENMGVTAPGVGKIINRSVKEAIDKKLTESLDNAPKYKPAEVKGKPVIWYDAWAVELGYRVIVKAHKAKLEFKEPQ